MRHIIYFAFFFGLLSVGTVEAQILNMDKIVPPEDVKPKEFEEYLVQLAWQNTPANRALEAVVGIYEQDKSLAKKAWMNDFSASFNLNNISLSQLINPDLSIPVFFPIYNLQAGFNLGTIFSTKNRIKTAEIRKEIALYELDQKKLIIRRNVLERYSSIQSAEDVREIRLEAEKDAYDNYVLASEKFKISEVSFEELNQASGTYYSAKEASTLSEGDIRLSIVQLEELIGVPYEEALKYKKKLEDRAKRKRSGKK